MQVMWCRALKLRSYEFCVVPKVWVIHFFEPNPLYRPMFARSHAHTSRGRIV